MKNLLKIFIAFAFVFLTFSFAEETATESNATTPAQEVAAEKPATTSQTTTTDNAKLIVGTSATFKPFEYISMSFEVVGFDIDLINELSKRLGFEYELKEMPFENLAGAMESGEINAIIAGLTITEERKASFDFTNAYFKTKNSYIKRKADPFATKADLKGKKIGIQVGTVQEEIAKGINGAEVVSFEAVFSAFEALRASKIDAVIIDSIVKDDYIKRSPNLVEFINEESNSEGLGIAFKKGENAELIEAINKTLEEMKNDGFYEQLLEKYHLKD